MSFLTKIVRNVYWHCRFKSISLNPVSRSPKCYKNFHCSSHLAVKMYMEHENHYAYSIMENKGYTININQNPTKYITLDEEEFKNLIETNWHKKTPGDIFKTFSQIAIYCSKNEIFISDNIFDTFIDHLTDSIKFATDNELESIFYSLNEFPEPESIRSRNHIEVWVALDDECFKRSRTWSYDELLRFTSLFFMLNVTKYSDFATKSLNKLSSKAKQLNPRQLVQTLFYVGIWRRSPFDIHNLEIHLHDNFSEFSIDDLAIMAMGFFKSKTPIRDANLTLKFVNAVIEHSKSIHEVSLAALLKLIRYSTNLTTDDRIYRLLNTLQSEVPRLSLTCNVHIALLGTSTINLHPGCLSQVAETTSNTLSQARVKDLERLVLTFGTFNFIPLTKACFFTAVIDELRNPKRMAEINQHGRSFACCIAYLSLLNIYPVDLIDKALSEEFLDISYGPQCYNYGREILLLHYVSEIYCKDSVKNRISDKSLKILSKKYTDFVPTEDYKKRYNITDRMLLDVIKTLRECRGGTQFVIGDHILPYHQRGDVIVCDNVNDGTPVDVQNVFSPKDFGLLRRPPNGHNWTVLVIAGKNSLIYDTDTPTGPLISKIGDLEAIGYNAALVPWSLYSKLETAKERADYLNNLIKNCRKNKEES